jgi:hypothetical protein
MAGGKKLEFATKKGEPGVPAHATHSFNRQRPERSAFSSYLPAF